MISPAELVLWVLIVAVCSWAQVSSSTKSRTSAAVVAISAEPLHRLVLENDDVRIYRLVLQPGAETLLHSHMRDLVMVVLDDSNLSEILAEPSARNLTAKAGEVTFHTRNFVHKLGNQGKNVSTMLVIELKHHWDKEVHACSEPKQCSHKITVGGGEIGETTSLFGNGFLTVYRHRLAPGGTLSSSYYSANGKDKVVFVPLSDMRVSFGGVDESLTKGQPYFCEATEVESTAGETEAQWVVVRIHVPR